MLVGLTAASFGPVTVARIVGNLYSSTLKDCEV